MKFPRHGFTMLPMRIIHVSAEQAAQTRQALGPYELETLVDRASHGSLTAYRVRIAPHAATATSFHRVSEEAYYVLSGEGTALINGAPMPLKAGDFLRLPPMTRHAFINGHSALVMLDVHTPGSYPDLDVEFEGERPKGFD
jgi:mannose-6-phosphate isomerase-like protein (cupin superfamily)